MGNRPLLNLDKREYDQLISILERGRAMLDVDKQRRVNAVIDDFRGAWRRKELHEMRVRVRREERAQRGTVPKDID
jgi:hypothetical protein